MLRGLYATRSSWKSHGYWRSSLLSARVRIHSHACKKGLVGINSEVPYRLDHAPTRFARSLDNLHESWADRKRLDLTPDLGAGFAKARGTSLGMTVCAVFVRACEAAT